MGAVDAIKQHHDQEVAEHKCTEAAAAAAAAPAAQPDGSDAAGQPGGKPLGYPGTFYLEKPLTGDAANTLIRMWPPNYGGAPGYPPAGASGYPPAGAPGYPPVGAPGYPPAGAPDYPPAGAPGYPPAGAPGYPPAGAPGYPPAGAPPPGAAPAASSAYPQVSSIGVGCCWLLQLLGSFGAVLHRIAAPAALRMACVEPGATASVAPPTLTCPPACLRYITPAAVRRPPTAAHQGERPRRRPTLLHLCTPPSAFRGCREGRRCLAELWHRSPVQPSGKPQPPLPGPSFNDPSSPTNNNTGMHPARQPPACPPRAAADARRLSSSASTTCELAVCTD